ncbi:MAG TPA: hypothetical protein VMT59_02975 [Gaiellaceae bacterium]|nr:hypothetical protein [Gaiellaceae bacterium]
MRKALEVGGYVAAAVLIAFGIAAIYMGVSGRATVSDSIKNEKIVGSADMTPAGITAEAKAAGLTNVTIPSCSVANKAIASGTDARCFAEYMRIHALEASGGLTYSQMPRYATADGKGTNDAAAAQKGANGQPMDNAARNIWVTETALSTALNTSYLATQIALFGIVVGIALLLTGVGFLILTLGGALRNKDSVILKSKETEEKAATTTPVSA